MGHDLRKKKAKASKSKKHSSTSTDEKIKQAIKTFNGPYVTRFLDKMAQRIGEKGMDTDEKKIGYVMSQCTGTIRRQFYMWIDQGHPNPTKTTVATTLASLSSVNVDEIKSAPTYRNVVVWLEHTFRNQDEIIAKSHLLELAEERKTLIKRARKESTLSEYISDFNALFMRMDSSAQPDAASKINIFLKGVSREHKKEVFQEIITSTGRDDDWTKFQNFILLLNERSKHTAACGNDSDDSASTVDSSESESKSESSSESESPSESSGSGSDSEDSHKRRRHAKKSKKGKEVKKHKSSKKTKHHSSGVVAPIPASTPTPPKPSVDEEMAKVMEGLKIFTAEVTNMLKNNTSARPVSKKSEFRCLWDNKLCGTTEHPTSKPNECPQFQQDVRNGWKVKVMKSRDGLKEFYHLDDADSTFVKPLIGDGGCRKRILDTFKQQAGVTVSSNVISVEVKCAESTPGLLNDAWPGATTSKKEVTSDLLNDPWPGNATDAKEPASFAIKLNLLRTMVK
ncbi:hypothetical protein HDU80_002709, partial [Chytriomyces hyalinus]